MVTTVLETSDSAPASAWLLSCGPLHLGRLLAAASSQNLYTAVHYLALSSLKPDEKKMILVLILTCW